MPVDAKDRVIPGLCRMALETTALEVYSARSYAAGLDRRSVDELWDDATTLRQRVALALYSDPDPCVGVGLWGVVSWVMPSDVGLWGCLRLPSLTPGGHRVDAICFGVGSGCVSPSGVPAGAVRAGGCPVDRSCRGGGGDRGRSGVGDRDRPGCGDRFGEVAVPGAFRGGPVVVDGFCAVGW